MCCVALSCLFVCLTLLASFFLPSHLSFKNMHTPWYYVMISIICVFDANVQPPPTHTITFAATHTVQDVNITVKEKTATVECVFLDGLSNATCYVVVTREGLPIYNKTISGLISLDFQGNYTVLIYCDAMETEPTFIRNVTRSTYGECV